MGDEAQLRHSAAFTLASGRHSAPLRGSLRTGTRPAPPERHV